MNRSKPKHSGKLRSENEWYVEPAWVVEALADAEDLSKVIYDPACGGGVIPTTLEARGHETYATDLVFREYDKWNGYLDFITDIPKYLHADIVCNPPYLRGEGTIEFINRSIEVGYRKSCFIINESFLFSRRRMDLFKSWPLKHIWFLSDRPSMPPGHLLVSGEVEAKGGTANYAWIVFEYGYEGNTTCGWIGKPTETTKKSEDLLQQFLK